MAECVGLAGTEEGKQAAGGIQVVDSTGTAVVTLFMAAMLQWVAMTRRMTRTKDDDDHEED